MSALVPFLHFPGTCEEALNFYKHCFGGEISGISRFKDAPMPTPESYKQKIMYSEFRSDDLFLLASDGPPDYKAAQHNDVSLSINPKDPSDAEKVFKLLAEGGKISMPLEKQFWGAIFGMVTDKFGFTWMVSCNIPKP
ncbi:MAG: VOC family protein [Ignavibacteriaceae bacterium]|nr:VOC family protein [Ignavibacteriaceae bacterium]